MATVFVRLVTTVALLAITPGFAKGQQNGFPINMVGNKGTVGDEMAKLFGRQTDSVHGIVQMSLLNEIGKSSTDKKGRVNTTMSPLNPSSYNVSQQCIDDVTQYLTDIGYGQTYALRMADSTGRLPAGAMEGNGQWIGSSRECRNVKNVPNAGGTFNGKYCQATGYMTGIPSQLLIGVCVPNSCIDMDVLTIINTAHVLPYLTNVNVVHVQCIEERPLATGTIVMFVIIGNLAVLMLAATLYDVIIKYALNNNPSVTDELPVTIQDGDVTADVTSLLNTTSVSSQAKYQPGIFGECLLAFSVLTNGGKILDARHSSGTLAAIHGIRVLSMWWVILGHVFGLFNNFGDNTLDYAQRIVKRFTFQPILNGTFSVDSFFFLSGLLVTYLTLRELTEGRNVNWFMFYFHRFWRLTPVYMFIVFFYTYVFPYLITGPYASYITVEDNACVKHWWTNLLYINNLVPWPGKLSEQCYGVSWYLANDMQFHVISPIIIILLYKIPILGYVVISALMATCLSSTIGICISRDLTASMLKPTIDKTYTNFNSSDYYYTKPWTRISAYLVGMIVGYLLVKTKCKLKMNIFVNLLGWAVALATGLAVIYGLYGVFHDHPLSRTADVIYMTLCRVSWSLALGYLTFACLTGNGGPINAILSWTAWIPISRLTYCAYLIHIMVLQTYVMNKDRLLHLSDLEEVYMFLGTLVLTYCVSFVVSMMAEAPMMRLEKILVKAMKDKRSKAYTQ